MTKDFQDSPSPGVILPPKLCYKEESEVPLSPSSSSSTALFDEGPCSLVFQDIVTLPLTCDGFYVKGVSGYATPGQILAIMGPTGGGKTTLLNAISGRVPISSGNIWANGEQVTRRIWRTKFGYVMQQDPMHPILTLKETLIYSALLRLSDSLCYKDKIQKVEDIIEILDLYKCQHTKVGDDAIRGLSGGERKRLSIACELITNPSVLLIDEPTSGLDSFTAIQLIKTLKHFAQQTNKNVILTVHQPSSRMFQMFDNLLALVSGRTAYFGPASSMSDHMSSLGLQMETNYNPADFLLDKLKYDEKVVSLGWEKVGKEKLKNIPVLLEDVETCSRNSNNNPSKSNTWQTSFLTQVKILTRRNVQLALPRIFSKVNCIQTVSLGFMAGLVWYQTPRTEQNIENFKGWMFFSSNFWMLFVLFQSLWAFPPEKNVVKKERAAGAYRFSSYYVSKILGELPLEIVLPTIYFLISYLFIGGTVWSTIGILGAQALSSVASQSVGLFFGACLSTGPATTAAAIFTVGAQLLGGYLTTNVPSYLKIFSLVYNGLRNLEIVEYFHGRPISCGVNSTFPSCSRGEEYVSPVDLLNENNNETDSFQFPFWAPTAMLLMVIVVFRVMAYFSLRRQL